MARSRRKRRTTWARWIPVTRRRVWLLVLAAVALLIVSLVARRSVLWAFGWGMPPVFLATLFLWWVILFRPRWLRLYLWPGLGSLGLLLSFMGALAFVEGSYEPLDEVNLGGRLGQTIIGPEDFLGGLRLVLLFLASVALLHPRGAGVAGRRLVGYVGVGISRLREEVRERLASWKARREAAMAEVEEEAEPPVIPGPVVSAENEEALEAPPRFRGETAGAVATHRPPGRATAPKISAPEPRRREGWRLPSPALLRHIREAKVDVSEGLRRAKELQKALADFSIEVEVEDIKTGPTVTQYWLKPGWVRREREVRERGENGRQKLDRGGNPVIRRVDESTRVKVDSILALDKDLALALAAPTIRFEAPIPGQAALGVEIPNRNRSVVSLRSVVESSQFQSLRARTVLAVALGKGTGGEPEVMDLAKMPHLLIAGATGSGKSVCVNGILCSLLLNATPLDVRLMLIDPKRVEFNHYNGIPHLLTEVVTEPDSVVKALRWVIQEMEERYRRMEALHVRNIEGYNEHPQAAEKMPYMVVAIDELADIMMLAAADAEQCLCRLAQLGRGTGIHLVVATQRPSVDVVTGLIKANFPSRISFSVASQVDSRTILDMVGAEKLLGKGDMLYLPSDAPKPKRVQGVLVSDDEIERLISFWKGQKGPSSPIISLEEIMRVMSQEEGKDDFLDKARELAESHTRISTSFLQRRLGIGYNRAARLMELLEEEGVVPKRGEEQ